MFVYLLDVYIHMCICCGGKYCALFSCYKTKGPSSFERSTHVGLVENTENCESDTLMASTNGYVFYEYYLTELEMLL